MKKVITISITMALLLSCVSAFAFDESIFYGGWALAGEKDDGSAFMEFFYLAPDHKVFYMNRSFTADEEGFGRQAVGSWSVIENGIHVKYGNTAETDAFMSKDGFFLIPGPGGYIPYGKVPVYGETKENADALNVPPGEYYVGEDFPAGRYTIEVSPDNYAVLIKIYENEDDEYGSSYAIGEAYGSYTLNVKLKDGNIVESKSTPFVLTPFAGLQK